MADLEKTGKKDEETTRRAQRTEASREVPERETDERMARVGGASDKATDASYSGFADAASSAFQSAGSAGGSAVGATRDVLNNVILATEEVGSNLVGGVTHVAIDVVHGVADVGETAVHTVTDLLATLVGGVKTIVSEALPARSGAERAQTGDQARYRRTERPEREEAIH